MCLYGVFAVSQFAFQVYSNPVQNLLHVIHFIKFVTKFSIFYSLEFFFLVSAIVLIRFI